MFKSVTLEISLKPFKQTDAAYISSVCKKVFTQWQALLKDRETVSIMLWAADGKNYVAEHGLDVEKYDNTAKMY